METENSKTLSKMDYDERNKNASSRYMEDTRKQYLLASNTESLQTLIENQKEELTRVLIELKSEYDLLTRESATKKQLIEEYNKKINMIQKANTANEKKQEEKKESTNHIKEGIELKKNKKNEELYTKKTLAKQVDKLNKDMFIIQKKIVKCENESVLLDKKMERAKLDENIIKEKGNQVYSKIEEQNQKNLRNKNENDLQVQYYETVIREKTRFMQFADERKERQKKIEQEAKNDAQDKQEVEKRRKLQLLMLYNQYLRKRMDEQLKKYEELEFNYEKIRDILGTQDLEVIINFIMERNKRYNYSVQVVEDKEHQIKLLKKEIKNFKSDLVKLKNEIIVNEKESNSKTETTIAEAGMDNEEEEIINLEKAKNEELLILGKKHNEINLAYNQVLSNIKGMQDYDQMHPLDIKEEEKKEEEEEKEEEPKEEKKGEDNGNLTPEEEECIKGYEALLKKILKAFNILYLCKSKQEFMNLMREKGINQQGEIRTNKMRNKTKKGTKRGTIRANKIKNEDIEVKKNNEGDEEDDFSNYDPDKNILARFIKEQKKEIDDFVNVKKVEVKKPVPNK
jgi:hypothetical protein